MGNSSNVQKDYKLIFVLPLFNSALNALNFIFLNAKENEPKG